MRPLLFLLSLAACQRSAPEEPVPVEVISPAPDPAELDAQALERARSATRSVGSSLKGRLEETMGAGGPVVAVSACADEAVGLTALALGRGQVRAGRASLKRRNPANVGPDWVQAWLQEAEASGGSEPAPLELVVEAPDGTRVARVLRPIKVEGLCLSCHGGPDQIPAEVQAILAARYPEDAATGYAVGDLRGALWAEAAVSPHAGRP